MTVTNYYEQLYAKKFENPGQNAKFLETYNPPKLSQQEAESLSRQISASDTEAVIKNILSHKSPGQDRFTENFTKI